jgi:hypothetical protein
MPTPTPIKRRAPVDPDATSLDLRPWHVPCDVLDDLSIDVEVDMSDGSDGSVVRTLRSMPECIEDLSLPVHLRDDMLLAGEMPRNEAGMRIGIIRLVRELGRDYLRWYGSSLQTDLAAIDTMQRHLRGLAGEVLAGRVDASSLSPEIVRHGALLGEILARRAGGRWGQLLGRTPGAWQMTFPSGDVVCPIGRVHRLVLGRGKDEDIVALFVQVHSSGAASLDAVRDGS